MQYQIVKVAVCSYPGNRYKVGYVYSEGPTIIKYDSINEAYTQSERLNTIIFGHFGITRCACKYEVQEIE